MGRGYADHAFLSICLLEGEVGMWEWVGEGGVSHTQASLDARFCLESPRSFQCKEATT